MGYSDDFYVSGNIIGYTGDVNTNPTVYFRTGNTFGRITQDHPNRNNIGRNVVRTKGDYSIGNTGPNGVCQEFYDGAVQHTSRNPFNAVSDDNRATLANAITNFPNQKNK
jgi:hypothetical protein